MRIFQESGWPRRPLRLVDWMAVATGSVVGFVFGHLIPVLPLVRLQEAYAWALLGAICLTMAACALTNRYPFFIAGMVLGLFVQAVDYGALGP